VDGVKIRNPLGVCVDDCENVLLADGENECAYVFRPDGTHVHAIQDRQITGPIGLCLTRRGEIVLVNSTTTDNKIIVCR
jgi:sugar lactone lactonase YvrE